jgi:hypothetical protein
VSGLGMAAQNRQVADGASGANIIGSLVDLLGQRTGSGQSEDVAALVRLLEVPFHRPYPIPTRAPRAWLHGFARSGDAKAPSWWPSLLRFPRECSRMLEAGGTMRIIIPVRINDGPPGSADPACGRSPCAPSEHIHSRTRLRTLTKVCSHLQLGRRQLFPLSSRLV